MEVIFEKTGFLCQGDSIFAFFYIRFYSWRGKIGRNNRFSCTDTWNRAYRGHSYHGRNNWIFRSKRCHDDKEQSNNTLPLRNGDNSGRTSDEHDNCNYISFYGPRRNFSWNLPWQSGICDGKHVTYKNSRRGARFLHCNAVRIFGKNRLCNIGFYFPLSFVFARFYGALSPFQDGRIHISRIFRLFVLLQTPDFTKLLIIAIKRENKRKNEILKEFKSLFQIYRKKFYLNRFKVEKNWKKLKFLFKNYCILYKYLL